MRLSLDEWGLRIAEVTATRGTCARRRVGAVAVDVRGVILSTGYNGVPRDYPHCTDMPCAGLGFATGDGLDVCDAIHAEANCIVFARDSSLIYTMYVTVAPCTSCVKLLLATNCRRIVFRADYAAAGGDLWLRSGRVWLKQ